MIPERSPLPLTRPRSASRPLGHPLPPGEREMRCNASRFHRSSVSLLFAPHPPRYRTGEVGGGPSHSPTGSDPEGSSPNEPGSGRCQPPTHFPRMQRNAAAMRGGRSDGRMSDLTKTADQTAAEGPGYRVLARKYRPRQLRRPDRPGRDGPHHLERLRERSDSAGLDPHRRARRRQDHDRAHSGPRLELRTARRLGEGPDPSTCR